MKKLLRLYATKMDDDSSFRIMLMTGDYELEMNDIVTEKSTSDEQGSKGGKSKKKDRMDVQDFGTVMRTYSRSLFPC